MKNIVVDSERQQWFVTLGLRPGASFEDIREAYQDMVKVWHPDRFNMDPRVQAKAEAKLKELNEAYHGLLSAWGKSGPQGQLQPGPARGSPPRLLGFDPFSQRWTWLEMPPAGDGPRGRPATPLCGKVALIATLAALALAMKVWFWPTPMPMTGSAGHPVAPVLHPQTAHPTPSLVSKLVAAVSPTPPVALKPLAPKHPAATKPVAAEPPGPKSLEKRPAPAVSRPTASLGPASRQSTEPYAGVIMLVTDGPFHTREYGTAFLVDHTKAITTSRVVTDAARYRFSLVAVTSDQRAYKAQVVCQSSQSGRREPQDDATASKDVALVQIEWNSPIKPLKDNTKAAGPKTPASVLAPLPLGRLGLRPGDRVVIVGYGRQKSGVTQVRQAGVVTNVWTATDGTTVFTGKFPNSPTPAERGAPVLNSAGEVVGVWSWEARTGGISGGGISAPSLTCP